MLLFIASACPLTTSAMGKLFKVVGSRALTIQQKFRVLFVDRIVVGEIPVFWLICLTETSFSSSKSAMYARCSSLKARIKTMHGKWISQTFLTDHSNQVRHTNWFSCHKRLCFHSFCINYLLFFEMYYIYKGCKSPFPVKYIASSCDWWSVPLAMGKKLTTSSFTSPVILV